MNLFQKIYWVLSNGTKIIYYFQKKSNSYITLVLSHNVVNGLRIQRIIDRKTVGALNACPFMFYRFRKLYGRPGMRYKYISGNYFYHFRLDKPKW